MVVTVRIHGIPPVEMEKADATLELATGATVAALLAAVGMSEASPVAAVVDGRVARRDQVLTDGCQVRLFPILTGG